MKKYIAIALILQACGTSDGQNTNADFQESGDGRTKGGVEYQPKEKEIVLQYRKDSGQTSLVVYETSDLPACSNANSGQLTYVKSDDTFFACDGGQWNEIDIRGKDGAPGAEGKAGAPGVNGKDGVNGKAAEPLAINVWKDPLTSKTWLIGAAISQGVLGAQNPCEGAWQLAKLTEVQDAVKHGLVLASLSIHGPDSFWTSTRQDSPAPNNVPLYVDANGQEKAYNDNTPAGVACLKGE